VLAGEPPKDGPGGDPAGKSTTSGVALNPAALDILRRTVARYSTERKQLNRTYGDGGRFGEWIGGLEYQPGHIALVTIIGLLLILLVAVLGIVFASADLPSGSAKIENIKNVILSILGLTGTILGYIFGKSGSLDKRVGRETTPESKPDRPQQPN